MKAVVGLLFLGVALVHSFPFSGSHLRPDLPDLKRVKRGPLGVVSSQPKTAKPEDVKPDVRNPIEEKPKTNLPLLDLPTDPVPKEKVESTLAPKMSTEQPLSNPPAIQTDRASTTTTNGPVVEDPTIPVEHAIEPKPIQPLEKAEPEKVDTIIDSLPILSLLGDGENANGEKRKRDLNMLSPIAEDTLLQPSNTDQCHKTKCGAIPSDMSCMPQYENGDFPKISGLINDCCPIYVCVREDGSTFLHYSVQVEEKPATKVVPKLSMTRSPPVLSSNEQESRQSAETYGNLVPFLSAFLPSIFSFLPGPSVIDVGSGSNSAHQNTQDSYEDMDFYAQPPQQLKHGRPAATFEIIIPSQRSKKQTPGVVSPFLTVPSEDGKTEKPAATPAVFTNFIPIKHHRSSKLHKELGNELLFGQRQYIDDEFLGEPSLRMTPPSAEPNNIQASQTFNSKSRSDNTPRSKRSSDFYGLSPYNANEAVMPFDEYAFFPF